MCRREAHPLGGLEREGQDMPSHGKLTLYIDDKAVGSAEIKTQPGNFSLVGEGLNVGQDVGELVTDDYPGELRGRSPAAQSSR
jgi:hypothetical protein